MCVLLRAVTGKGAGVCGFLRKSGRQMHRREIWMRLGEVRLENEGKKRDLGFENITLGCDFHTTWEKFSWGDLGKFPGIV